MILCFFITGSLLGFTGLLVAAPVVAAGVQSVDPLAPENLYQLPFS
jgi:predicted PurR-regulated permease PerM